METSLKIVLCLTWLSLLGTMARTSEVLSLSSYVRQEKRLISAAVGDNVTLQCFHKQTYSGWIFWYKQSLGQMPRLLAAIYVFGVKSSFFNEFNNTRFTVECEDNTCQLAISDLHTSDSATYFCASSHTRALTFAEGVTVTVQGSGLNLQALVYDGRLRLRGSKTLSCTLHTGSCDGEHSVYWLESSEEMDSGFIYTKVDRCVYTSSSGAYDCAVLSCGHMLFENGTKFNLKDEVELHAALAVPTLLSVLLAFTHCIIIKGNSGLCADSCATRVRCSKANTKTHQNEDTLYYAAFNDLRRSEREMDDIWTECVYSDVKTVYMI